MASGKPVVQIVRMMPPATLFATRENITGTSTPAEIVPVHAFDQTTVEYMDFLCELYGYDGGGLTFTIKWSAAVATAEVVWSLAVRRIGDDIEDVDTTAHTYVYNDTGALTVPTAIGEVGYDNLTFTDGADMDSWANTELAIVRLRRFASTAGDDAAGDAYLWSLVGLET